MRAGEGWGGVQRRPVLPSGGWRRLTGRPISSPGNGVGRHPAPSACGSRGGGGGWDRRAAAPAAPAANGSCRLALVVAAAVAAYQLASTASGPPSSPLWCAFPHLGVAATPRWRTLSNARSVDRLLVGGDLWLGHPLLYCCAVWSWFVPALLPCFVPAPSSMPALFLVRSRSSRAAARRRARAPRASL